MLNSGSMACSISEHAIEKLNSAGVLPEKQHPKENIILIGCGGLQTRPEGFYDLEIQLYGARCVVPTLVVPGQHDDLILGSNVIKHVIRVLKGDNDYGSMASRSEHQSNPDVEQFLSMFTNVEQWRGSEFPDKIGTVKLTQAVTLLPRHEHLVWGRLPASVPMSPGSTVVVEPTNSKAMPRGVLVGRLVTPLWGDRWVPAHYQKLRQVLTDMEERGIIRKSSSEYASPLVMPKLDACEIRWVFKLASYSFDLKHLPGKRNVVADTLSRDLFAKPICQRLLKEPYPTLIQEANGIEEDSVQDAFRVSCQSQSYRSGDHPTFKDVTPMFSAQELQLSQEQDSSISKVLPFVAARKRPSRRERHGANSKILRFFKQWDKFEVHDGMLYRVTRDPVYKQRRCQYVLPLSLKEKTLMGIHNLAGHQGQDCTLSLARQRFNWPDMERDVRAHVRCCQRCVLGKSPEPAARVPLESIKSSALMELVCMDFWSAEDSRQRSVDVLVVTDHFTKLAHAFPCANQTARQVAKKLWDNVFCVYGFPERIHSDQGTNFESNLIAELLRLAGVAKSHTTAYHPMGNEGTERFNRTLGNMLRTLPLKEKHQWPQQIQTHTFAYLLGQYGDVTKLSIGGQRFVLLSGPKTIREVFVEKGDFFIDRPSYPIIEKLFKGLGLISSSGHMWRQQRRFTLSTLKYFGVGKKTLETSILEESRFLYKSIKNEQGKPFDPHYLLYNGVSNIICSLVFGHRFEYGDGHFHEMLNNFDEIIQLPVTPWGQLYNMFPGLLNLLPGKHQSTFSNREKIIRFIEDEVKKRKEDWNPSEPRDYIDCYLEVLFRLNLKGDTSGFNEENLLYCVIDLFAAGTETLSKTLLWGLLYMVKYPEIQEKVQNEIERVIGQERQPSMDDRPSMPYTYAVIHEIQRFANILPITPPRVSHYDTTIAGYDIPKGVMVLPLLMPILYDKSEYQTADRFNPEHFLDKEGKFVKRENVMPFSVGKRMCPGEELARMELFLFFTSFLQRFTFRAPDRVKLTMESVIGITRGPKPFKICAIPCLK
ncbi:CP2J2 protein, partial [Amia calva]|nr:CP2J2 protein [Amia calva]